MKSDELEELLVSLGRQISEIRFKVMPDPEILELICEKNERLRIHLSLETPLRLGELQDSWCTHVVSANLQSDGLSDWAEIHYFASLKELELSVTWRSDGELDYRDVDAMRLALLNLPELRHLLIDTRKVGARIADQIDRLLVFPGSQIVLSPRTKRRMKSRQSGTALD